MKLQNRNRALLLAVAGGYVVYLAYEMMRDELAGKSSMPMWLCILFVILLGGAGLATLFLAWKTYRTKDTEESGQTENKDPECLK